jgi:hypothetical protein
MANSHERRKLRRAGLLSMPEPTLISGRISKSDMVKIETISGRALVLSGAFVIASIALDLTVTKYGVGVPDIIIISLWLLPIVPLAWWVYTHPGLVHHRGWFENRLSQRPISTVFVLGITLACIGGIGRGIWVGLTRPQITTTKPSIQTQPDCSVLTITGGRISENGGAGIEMDNSKGVCVSGTDIEKNKDGGVIVTQPSDEGSKSK